MFYKYIKEQNKEGIHKNKESILSMLLILPDVKRHLTGSKRYRSTLKHKKPKKANVITAIHILIDYTATVQLVKIVKSSVKKCLSQIAWIGLTISNETIQQLFTIYNFDYNEKLWIKTLKTTKKSILHVSKRHKYDWKLMRKFLH